MYTEQNKNIVIVGGGYLGAMSALMFSQRKDLEVILVEKQDRLGGLYNSAWRTGDLHFDFGSRAILATGVELLDEALFNLLPDDEYPKSTDNLKEFSFQNGKFCGHSNCLDARTLEPEISNLGISEMKEITGDAIEGLQFNNLGQFANATYGTILTEQLIRPAMIKLTGLQLEDLDINALAIHGLHRIIIADQEDAKLMKSESDFNGNRIAFAKYNDNESSLIKTYPQTSGLGDFCDRIKNHLNEAPNVKLVLNNSVTEIKSENNCITSLILEDGVEMQCDRVLWTIPSIFLARLLNKKIEGIAPPKFRNTVLAHYTFHGNLKTDAYYVYNYDLDFLTYRTTFYDNFSNRLGDLRSATIEAFWDTPDLDLKKLEQKLFDEMIETECISADSKLEESNLHLHRGSWPNFATDFFENQAKVNDAVIGEFSNLHLCGKANGKHHSGALVHSAYELYQQIYDKVPGSH